MQQVRTFSIAPPKGRFDTLKHCLLASDPAWVETASGTLAILWGIWLGWPGSAAFDYPYFEAMRSIASQGAWAIFLLIAGLIQYVIGGKGSKKARHFVSFCAAITWTYIGWGFFVTAGVSLISTVAMSFALASLWAWAREGGYGHDS